MGTWNTSIIGNDTAKDLYIEYSAAFYKFDVEEALKRVGQADTNSSTPNQALGNNPNNDSNNKITTMAQLNTLLDGLNIEKK